MTGLDAERAEALRRARVRWRAAEDRLFPVVLVDPEAYRRALCVVGLFLEELRLNTTCPTQLLGLDVDPAPLLSALPASSLRDVDFAGSASGGDRLTLEAAFAVRDRELAAAAQCGRRAAAIALARSTGATWVDLEGSWEAVLCTGVRHTEMHLPTARALVAMVDPYSGDGPHRLELVVLDGDTGTPVETTDRDRAFADRAEWLAERERWRADIEGGR
ncbi:MAG: hypothetical protein ACRDQI_15550 [Pseudonocardiaceae bacterium]